MKTEINAEVIENLASLSKLRFSEPEKEEMKGQVKDIINMLDQLGADETTQVEYVRMQKISDLREDIAEMGLAQEEVFLNAPNSSNGYFVVPKVVD